MVQSAAECSVGLNGSRRDVKKKQDECAKRFDYGRVVQKRVGVQLAVSTNNRWSRPMRITTDDQGEAGLAIEANMRPKGDDGER